MRSLSEQQCTPLRIAYYRRIHFLPYGHIYFGPLRQRISGFPVDEPNEFCHVKLG